MNYHQKCWSLPVFKTIFFILLLAWFWTACDFHEENQQQKPQTSVKLASLPAKGEGNYQAEHVISALAPSVSNPLDHALSLIGLKHSDLVRPLYQEEGYTLACRIPLIDQVAKSPFYLHQWADKTSLSIQKNAKRGLTDIINASVMTINGGVKYKFEQAPGNSFPGGLREAYQYICRKTGNITNKETSIRIQKAGLSEMFDNQLGLLVAAIADASHLARQATAQLTKKELDYLINRPESYFFPDGIRFNFLTAPTHTQSQIVPTTRKIDFVRMYTAALFASNAIDRFHGYIQGLANSDDPANYFSDGLRREGTILELSTPIGEIVILGQGQNEFSKSSALLVDLGGNDRYLGPMAVGHLVPGSVSVVIDIGGNDTYDNKQNKFAQGFGCLSVGMLADFAGNDQYISGDMSQGAGMYGVGVLADFNGKDRYQMGLIGQGFGLFGIGLLVDLDGGDLYVIGGMGQGAGSTMGFGILCDSKGNDKYFADRRRTNGRLRPDKWSHVQGAGLSIRPPDWKKRFSYYGGIGFLSDGDGNDYYYASDGNCMGASYFMSVGALVDHAGNDKYTPQGGNGLGWAVHLSNGILIDRKGDDFYSATHSGGVGSDRSIGFLADYAGDDIYGPSEGYVKQKLMKKYNKMNRKLTEAALNKEIQKRLANLSYGASLKPKGIGILMDYQGNDQYWARNDGRRESLGGVIPPELPENWSHALLLDLGGKDYYFKKDRKNNHFHKYYNHGLFYDTEYNGSETIGKLPLSLKSHVLSKKAQATLNANPLRSEIRNLLDPDLFVRYRVIGKLFKKGSEIIDGLIALLSVSNNEELNLEIIQILDEFIIKRQTHWHPKFETLLKAKAQNVRSYAARKLGLWKVDPAQPALIRAMDEKVASTRSDIIWAIGEIGSHSALELLINAFQTDSSVECRRNAIIGLARGDFEGAKGNAELMDVFFEGLKDPDVVIRTYAASGLYRFGQYPIVLESLFERLSEPNENVYVKRSAARSLILRGVKKAIPLLIETLQYPSIDTFEFYDHDLIKDLAFYCGVDFPKDQRYSYSTWQQWWKENGQNVNINQNIAIMNKINRAFEAKKEDEGISIFENLMALYPENIVIRNRYKRFCYEWINFRLLTQAHITYATFERCLRLQKILVELEPENPKAVAHLVYFRQRLSKLKETVEN